MSQKFYPYQKRAFSLVEVTIAVGIVAFAFLAILALMPVGLTRMRQAKESNVSTLIIQQISDEIKQTDIKSLKLKSSQSFYRYFDIEGNKLLTEIGSTTPLDETGATAVVRSDMLYTTKITINPVLATDTVTVQPSATNCTLMRIVIQIAYNPKRMKATSLFAPESPVVFTSFLYVGDAQGPNN